MLCCTVVHFSECISAFVEDILLVNEKTLVCEFATAGKACKKDVR